MKTIIAYFALVLLTLQPKTDHLLKQLKNFLKEKDTGRAITFILNNPSVLDKHDDNGSSGFMLVAYSGLEVVLDQALKIKKEFSFHETIVAGKIESVKVMLDSSQTNLVNSYSKDGFTPLSLAAFFNQTKIAKMLVEKGANPNLSAKNPSKVNALHSAVAKENLELCKLFLDMGADINAAQINKVTALHSAVHRGNLQLVKLFIGRGANPNLEMDNGQTPLSIAQTEGHKDIESFLLNQEFPR